LSSQPTSRALVEQELIAIVKSVMHEDVLKTKSSLFEQGLTSFSAVEICMRIESRFQIRLRTSTIFDYPTLEALTAFTLNLLDSGDSASTGSVAVATEKRADEEALVREILRKKFGV
jgi:acyl carrier protein